MKRQLVSLGVLLIKSAFFVGAGAGAAYSQTFKGESLRRSFPAQPGGVLRVKAHQGSVEVKASAGDTVEIEVMRKVNAATREEAESIFRELTVDFEPNAQGVEVRSAFHGRRKHVNLEYIIRVPRRYNVEVKTWGGNVSVSGVEGRVQAETAGGGLRFERIDGAVRGETSGGSIEAVEIAGDVLAYTSGGRIDVRDVRGQLDARTSGGVIDLAGVTHGVKAQTGGGDIRARIASQPRGDYNLETGGAGVTVYLAADIRLNVSAKTSAGGRVKTDFPIAVKAESGDALETSLNGGGAKLSIVTSGADIHLRKI
ncbi:MAG TPA: DUF4097 family beta strand repeat-containing protein [Pyrinomonadaceae bacterium]|nr:DUF4097 family beta strand repeat-containing protein [Pyrinomonadaceae bacterium]